MKELSCDGRSVPCQAGRSDPATSCGIGPLTRIPLPSHAAAAACPDDTCPASHSARRPSCVARYGARLRIAPPSRARPRATACRPLHAQLDRRARAVSARRSAMAVEGTPPFARDRDVALRALAARRPHCRAIAARHVRHLPVPPQTPDFRPATPLGGASDCDALYHVHHYARISRVLSRPLAAARLDADLAPRHYRKLATPRRKPRGGCDVLRHRRVVTGWSNRRADASATRDPPGSSPPSRCTGSP